MSSGAGCGCDSSLGSENPSIFNDVIGPVMRGPSSSHCAAAVRIGRLARALMGGDPREVRFDFERGSALAETYDSQGSDIGLFGGLMGWDAADERLANAEAFAREAGLAVEFHIGNIGATHPNTYKITLTNADERHTMTALSLGGGMIEVIELDGATVSIAGDCHETLLFVDSDPGALRQRIEEHLEFDALHLHPVSGGSILEIKTRAPLPEEHITSLRSLPGVTRIRSLPPILPVLSGEGLRGPYTTYAAMRAYNTGKDLPLWELAVRYECARGGLEPDDVLCRMTELVRIMRASIAEGVAGTEYADRILPAQAPGYQKRFAGGALLGGDMINRIQLYVTAMMETKSSMGVIVAAPTAGACAALPAACIGAAECMDASEEEMAKALLAAAMAGIFIAAQSTFAAEVGGCQAEGGSASGMAAAGLVTLAGGGADTAIAAASMALQNTLGLICDPVANRVEVPCLGKNMLAAVNALACANMALAGCDAVIPLDEVIDAMNRVGASMPCELRCTSQGGLATTETSKAIKARLHA